MSQRLVGAMRSSGCRALFAPVVRGEWKLIQLRARNRPARVMFVQERVHPPAMCRLNQVELLGDDHVLGLAIEVGLIGGHDAAM